MDTKSLKDTIKGKIANAIKENLKADEREFVNPWTNQDKAAVVQNSRCFGDSPIDAEKCMDLLTRILYLIQQGETFTAQELTSLFFGVTKLFQSKNTRLRRMVFLVIKELEPAEEEVFICVSCLIKDMNGTDDRFRANSIRVLARVLDSAMVAQIDRYLKTAIVDKNPFVASSALVSGLSLMKSAPEVVRRWVSEIQETFNSKHDMVQFHALALIYELKKNDRLALHKVITGLAKGQIKSPMAECLLIRYAAHALMTEKDPSIEKTLVAYLESCLRHKQDMVTCEATRAFCQLAAVDRGDERSNMVFGYDITNMTTTLEILLSSPKPVVRFGAIRTLNMLAQHRPQIAAKCNCDMEPLLSDPNRTTATVALTTLLKTGHESNVDRLAKQISSFMSDTSDSFKIEIVRAIKGLCKMYPAKHKTLMSLISTNLREDGSAEYKKELVEALIFCISELPPAYQTQAQEVGLLQLCEFIEDCEYPDLCRRILCFLGETVPIASRPCLYIRAIYNRLILENAVVRAAAVDTLTKIAMKCPSLRGDIQLLLEFGENDNDDEVRDRINLYSGVLRQCLEGGEKGTTKPGFQELMTAEMPFSVDAMFDGLMDHMSSDSRGAPFNFAALPTDEVYKATQKQQASSQVEKKKPGALGAQKAPTAAEAAQAEAEQKSTASAELARVLGELMPGDQLGPLQHSGKAQPLTESEAEYTVHAIKHMFKQHVVLEMLVGNTVEGITLENIEVRLTGVQPAFTEVVASAVTRLAYGQQASAHVVLQKSAGDEVAGAVVGNFAASLHFIVKEDGDDLGYDEDYNLETVQVTMSDYMFPKALQTGHFKSNWEQLGKMGTETTQKLSLNYKTLNAAVDGIVQSLGMHACENTGKVEAGVRGHTLNLSGTFLGGNMCLVRALVGMDPNHGCVAKVTLRAKTAAICDAVAGALM